jgi:hypothetical protein
MTGPMGSVVTGSLPRQPSQEQPKPGPAPEPEPKHAGRRLEWPTLWHKDQIPFPWGSALRLRRRRCDAATSHKPVDGQ